MATSKSKAPKTSKTQPKEVVYRGSNSAGRRKYKRLLEAKKKTKK